MAFSPPLPVSSRPQSPPNEAPLSRLERWRPAPGTWAAAGLYALATVLVTWPNVLTMRSALLGHPGNDTWNHVWGFWWVAEEILHEHRWPAWTDLISWPRGGSLFFIDTFNAVITLPIQALTGPVFTYNLVVMGSLWFSAFCAWMLVRHVVRNEPAALVAGMVYGFSPHLLAQAHNAITESLNAGWLALFLLLLLRLVERPTLGRGLMAWLALVACGLSNWYYGLFAGIASAVLLLHRAVGSAVATRWRRVLGYGAVGALCFAPLAMGGLLLLQRSIDAPDALVNRDPDFVWNSLIYHNISDLQSFFRPGRFYSPDLKELYGEELLIITYLVWTVLILAGAALLRHRRRRELVRWVVLGVVFWIFSLGPYLYVFGEYLEVNGHRIPLPFLAFFEALPLFSRISHPFRFVVGVELALGTLAAFLLAQTTRWWDTHRAWLLGIGTAALVLAEVALVSPARIPLARSHAAIPEAIEVIRDDPEPGAVLDLPIAVPILERAVYNWYQIEHGRPIPYTLNEPIPPGLRNNQLCQFLLHLEASRARLLPRTLPDLELVLSSRILSRQGYRFVVVHNTLYPAVKRRNVHLVLGGLLGPPVFGETGDAVTVYRMP